MLKNKMSLRVLITMLGLSFLNVGVAQNPYELQWKKDATVLSVGVVGQIAAISLFANDATLTEERIELLDKNDVNAFDRIATEYNNDGFKVTSDALLVSALASPLMFLTDKGTRSGFLEIGVMTLEAFLVNSVTVSFAKELTLRTRPYVYNPSRSIDDKTTLHARASFYSGHTSTVSTMTFFGAKVFSDYYPESKFKPLIWTLATVVPAATGFSRVAAGEHFPTDVLTGYAMGALIGYFVPHFHKKKDKTDKVGFSIYPGFNSVGLTMTW